MSVSPLQCLGDSLHSSLRCVTLHKHRSPYKFLAWLRIPLSVNWLLRNAWDKLEFVISRDSCFSSVRLFSKNVLLKHKKTILLLLFILSAYLLYCCLVSQGAVMETTATSDLVLFSHPSNTFSRAILVSIARLSGVHLFSPEAEVDLRASERGEYMRGYSSLMDLNGYVTLSCVSPALKLGQYLLATGYWEQLQNGMRNLIDLGEVAADTDRLAVFPQVSNSRLFGVPNLGAKSVLLSPTEPLDLYYSISELNQIMCRRAGAMYDTFHSFLERSPRQILLGLYVHSKHTKDEWLLPEKWANQALASLETQPVIDCTEFLKDSIISKLERSLNAARVSLFQARFYVHRAVCINASVPMHVLEFSQTFSRLSGEPNSVLLANWRGLARGRGDTSKRTQIETITSFPALPPWPVSEKVYKASRTYMRALNLSRPLIGLHVRLEKLGGAAHRSDTPDHFMSQCISELTSHLKQIQSLAPEATSLLPICDLGMYGSESCQGCKLGNWALNKFIEKGIRFRFYDPSLSDGQTDTGFVSLVEMSTLIESQFLVLVGGGGFQRQLADRFRHKLALDTFPEGDMRLKRICDHTSGQH